MKDRIGSVVTPPAVARVFDRWEREVVLTVAFLSFGISLIFFAWAIVAVRFSTANLDTLLVAFGLAMSFYSLAVLLIFIESDWFGSTHRED